MFLTADMPGQTLGIADNYTYVDGPEDREIMHTYGISTLMGKDGSSAATRNIAPFPRIARRHANRSECQISIRF